MVNVAFVQKVAAGTSGSGTTCVLTVGTGVTGFSGVTTVGNVLAIGGSGSAGGHITGVTDSQGNTWRVDVHGTSSGMTSSIAVCRIAPGKVLGTGNTITVTFSVTGTTAAGCTEFTGLALSSGGLPVLGSTPVAVHAGSSSVSAVTANVSRVGGGLVFSAGAANQNTQTVALSGITDPDSLGTWVDLAMPAAPGRLDCAYQIAPVTPSAYSVTWQQTSAANMDAAVAYYVPASTAIPTVPQMPAGYVVQLSDLQNLATAAAFALNKPMTRVYDGTGGEAIGTSATNVTFTTASFDMDGMWAIGHPGRLTIQTPGWYKARYSVNLSGVAEPSSGYLISTTGPNNPQGSGVTSVPMWASYCQSISPGYLRGGGLWPFYLYTGDYLQVWAFCATTGNSTGIGTGIPGVTTSLAGSTFSLEYVSSI